jgi:sugar/nucleoside kinase (ribokinase family)
LVTDPGLTTSYSVIISPPGQDRFFLHHPGANDAFGVQDLDVSLLSQAALFHFGYPPVMRRMYADGGAQLAELFRRAKSTGATTSLDMSLPDPSSESGQANWAGILRQALPNVDIFLPSFEEILYMLRRDLYDRLDREASGRPILLASNPDLLDELSAELIGMGAKIVVIKLGERGLYLRAASAESLQNMGRAAPQDPSAWAAQRLWAPCFRVGVVGTTGSGDATIAGFLSALLRGLSPGQALTAAVAVGACNVEAADALSGLRSWEDTLARIAAGWERLPLVLQHPGWRWRVEDQLWEGLGDA